MTTAVRTGKDKMIFIRETLKCEVETNGEAEFNGHTIDLIPAENHLGKYLVDGKYLFPRWELVEKYLNFMVTISSFEL